MFASFIFYVKSQWDYHTKIYSN